MARQVGHRSTETNGEWRVPFHLLYPTDAAPSSERLGPYEMSVARDAAPAEPLGPLVVISHGSGGSGLVYRDLAAHLARAGFVVALPEHPGNNRADDSLAGTLANLEQRPRHISLVIDAVLDDPQFAGRLPPWVAVIGHSLGGYTALALAGGRAMAYATAAREGPVFPVSTKADARVASLVLLAPAVFWFMGPGALAAVTIPILMMTGDRDPLTPEIHARTVLEGVANPSRVDHRVIAGAGHFAFLSPFPPERRRPDFPPSQDPPGFDREAFHPVMNASIERFLRDRLVPPDPAL